MDYEKVDILFCESLRWIFIICDNYYIVFKTQIVEHSSYYKEKKRKTVVFKVKGNELKLMFLP